MAIPGKIVEIHGSKATVQYGEGVTSTASITLVEAKVGDYVLVHAGFAIQVLSEKEALETLEVWAQVLDAGGEPDA